MANPLFSQTKSDRQPPDASQIQPFVKCSVVDGTVTEEGHGDAIRLQELETVSRPRRLEDTGADDATGAHHADLGREEVHAPTPSARTTGLATKQLGDQ